MKVRLGIWLLLSLLLLILPASAGASVTADGAPTAEAVLRRGDRGTAVSLLQRSLTDLGFNPGPVDGIYGPRTQAAVRAAQTEWGLAVDGQAGPVTLGRMTEAAEAQRTADSGQTAPAAEEGKAALAAEAPASAAQVAGTTSTDQAPAGVIEGAAADASAGAAADASAGAAADASAGVTLPLSPHLFSLTFNGDPDPATLPALLATLKRYGMQATFFVHGEAAEQQPQLLAQIVAGGHEVASNGFAKGDMTQLSSATMSAQLARANQAIRQATGSTPHFFRPPSGRFNGNLVRSARDQKLQLVLWTNIAAGDAPGAQTDELVKDLAGTISSGAILLLHQDRPNTVAALPQLLQTLQGKGYQSVTLARLLTP